jgi:hypothetical protein
MPSIPGLTTRETAAVVWLLIVFALLMTQSEIRASTSQVLKTVFGSRWLVGLLVGAIAYITGLVLILRYFGYWDSAMTKTTAYWFLGTGFATAFSTNRKDEDYFHRLLRNNLTLAVVVGFLVNLYTFPLLVELVLVPVAALFAIAHTLAGLDPKLASAREPLDRIMILIGIIVLSFSMVHVVREFGQLATIERAKEFFLPLFLTLGFIPFLYGVALLIAYETLLRMVRRGLKEDEQLWRLTRGEIFRACGLSLARAQKFEASRGKLWGAEDEAEAKRVVDEIRATF